RGGPGGQGGGVTRSTARTAGGKAPEPTGAPSEEAPEELAPEPAAQVAETPEAPAGQTDTPPAVAE
ncbi:MAG: hypothetical protein P4L84_15085, partial [Isosphaeraceae bacterium]|nr:hypothetical protein [Isosphaeraceae bacterium]